MIDPITTVKIFSSLGNNSSLFPIAVKDAAHIAGMTTASYITGKEIEGKDRLIDEVGSTAMWIGGIPFYKKVIDLTLYKLAKYSPDVDVRILKDENLLKKAIQHAPTQEIKESIKKAANNIKMVKGLNLAKFLVSTALTLLSYSALTTFRHKHTEKNIIKEIHKEETEKKLKEEYFKGKMPLAFKSIKSAQKTKTPSFGMNMHALQDFMFNPVKNMMIVDGGITASRLGDSRNPQDFMGYVIKEGSFWAFMYFAGKKIQEHFEKKSEQKYNKSIDLDIRAIQSDELKDGFKKGTISANVEEFNKLKTPEQIYEFLCTKGDNLVVKMAKLSGTQEQKQIITLYKNTDKVDTQHYIDLEEVKNVGIKLEKLYKQYSTSGEEIEAFLAKTIKLKRGSVLKNIGTCMGVLGLVVPGIILVIRFVNKDNKDFMVKKESHEELTLSNDVD
ncbi:MAG: hypothetical protein WCG95_01775 [bacterium]